jgi:hypothetical protein
MEAIRLDSKLIEYVMQGLTCRKADVDVELTAGVSQGDPLSMILFIIAINPLLRELAEKFGEKNMVVYADDILLVGSRNFTEGDVEEIAISA